MSEILIAAALFIGLVTASLASLVLSAKFHPRYRNEETHNVIKLAANIFVVTTSLVLGLLFNSAKNTFEAVDRNVHAFATELVLLDRSLRHYGPEASDARQRLAAYVRKAIDGTWSAGGAENLDDRAAEALLEGVGDALAAIRPSDPLRIEMWREAQSNLQNVVKRRLMLIGESDGTIPGAFLAMLSAWLVLIFTTYGYRAPRNAVVVTTVVVAAFLISASIYLILDFDQPFAGAIQVSSAPMLRAEEQLRR